MNRTYRLPATMKIRNYPGQMGIDMPKIDLKNTAIAAGITIAALYAFKAIKKRKAKA